MFTWIRKSRNSGASSVPSRKLERSRSLSRSTSILNGTSTTSIDTEDTFDFNESTERKSRSFSVKDRFAKKIVSAIERRFRAKRKTDWQKNRSTSALVDDFNDTSGIQEDEEIEFSIDDSKLKVEKKQKLRRTRSIKRILSRKDFARTRWRSSRAPLDEYEKKRLQVSRDSGWEGASSSNSSFSSSTSSLIGLDAEFYTSSPVSKVPGGNGSTDALGWRMISASKKGRRSRNGLKFDSPDSESTPGMLSPIRGKRSQSDYQPKVQLEPTRIPDATSGVNAALESCNLERRKSADCVLRVWVNAPDEKSSTSDTEIYRNNRKRCTIQQDFYEVTQKFKTTVTLFESSTASLNILRPASTESDQLPVSVNSDSASEDEQRDTQHEEHYVDMSAVGLWTKSRRHPISKSSAELFEREYSDQDSESAEFSSIQDLSCAVSRQSRSFDAGSDVSGNGQVRRQLEEQRISLSFDCEDGDTDGRGGGEDLRINLSELSNNSSYVITMYV